jgi:opacity protein-like surface antigen
MRLALATLALLAFAASSSAAEWHVQKIDTPARVTAVETVDGQVRINAGGLWYRLALQDQSGALSFFNDMPEQPTLPDGALRDSRVATGKRDIARAWLAHTTTARSATRSRPPPSSSSGAMAAAPR